MSFLLRLRVRLIERLMRFVSSLLRHVFYPSLSKIGFFQSWRNRRMRNDLTILTYHGVIPKNYKVEDGWLDGNLVKPEVFRQQLRLLKSNYTVIYPEELHEYLDRNNDLPPNSVLLTCDDGLLNHVTEMLPILKEEALSCLFFVTTGSLRLDSTMLWHEELYLLLKFALKKPIQIPDQIIPVCSFITDIDECRVVWRQLVNELSKVDHEKRRALTEVLRQEVGLNKNWNYKYFEDPTLRHRFILLSSNDLEGLVNAGMALGSHSCTHPILSQLPSHLARREIEESRRSFEQELGVRVWAFSYPFGDPSSMTLREMSFVEEAGYKCGLINFGGLVPSRINRPFCLPRVHVSADMTIAEFDAYVSGFHQMLQGKIMRSRASRHSI